nr:hypothetical protein [Wolbachia endosymbiont (group A) of Volucella inflata]
MSLTDIAHRINELASSWEQFKLINDRKLKEIESKGRADSATIEQLCKHRTDEICQIRKKHTNLSF